MDVAQKSSVRVPRSNYVVHDPFKRKKPVPGSTTAGKAEDKSQSSIIGNAAEERLNGVTDKVDSGSEVADDSPSKKESDLDRDKDEENSGGVAFICFLCLLFNVLCMMIAFLNELYIQRRKKKSLKPFCFCEK